MRKKLKIAMILSYDPSRAGGVQEHLFFLSKTLMSFGHMVDIYGPENSIYSYQKYHSIMKSTQIPMIQGNLVSITMANKKKSIIFDKINREKYDIIHIHDPHVPFFNFDLMKELKAPKIATFHVGWDDDSLVNIVSPLIALYKSEFSTYFKGAIFVSNLVKKRWIPICSSIVKKSVIYNGVDSSLFLKKKKIKKPNNLLFLGRLVPRKGPDLLLKSFKRVLYKIGDARLTIIGGGDLEKKLFSYIKKNKMEKSVKIVGEIVGRKKADYYQKAAIFCAPYIDEAFGLTILESLACGTPVVGFRNQAFDEIFNDYPGKKYLVKSKDEKALSVAIIDLLKNSQKRKEIESWGINKIKDFSWEKVAKETEEFYYRVLNKKA